MDKSKVFKQNEIPMNDQAVFNLMKKWEEGKTTENDFIYFGANELEGRKSAVFVRVKDWDGDLEALKNE